MSGYTPIYISSMETGLVQNRVEFILPNDAYPTLQNMFVWRERIKRRQGLQTLGRLSRLFTSASIGNSSVSGGIWSFTIYSTLVPPITPEANAQIVPGSVTINIGAVQFTDNGDGTLSSTTPGNSGVINYLTGVVTLTTTQASGVASTITFSYNPNLPVMGLRTRELNNTNNEQLVAFDTKYAYIFSTQWQEFIPGTTWSGNDFNFFWSTNYWVKCIKPKTFFG
jgi:hypothetical protein